LLFLSCIWLFACSREVLVKPTSMYATRRHLEARQGKSAPDRLAYLQQLVNEFQCAKNPTSQEQVRQTHTHACLIRASGDC